MGELLKVMLCCFGPAILYQIAKTVREYRGVMEKGGKDD